MQFVKFCFEMKDADADKDIVYTDAVFRMETNTQLELFHAHRNGGRVLCESC